MQDGNTDIPMDMCKTWCPTFPAVEGYKKYNLDWNTTNVNAMLLQMSKGL